MRGKQEVKRESVSLPVEWSWDGPWRTQPIAGQTDAEGWMYKTDFPETYSSPSKGVYVVRTRRWFRRRKKRKALLFVSHFADKNDLRRLP